MLPSHNLKIMSVWINSSCMVTSHKMQKTQMDNHGFKSDYKSVIKQLLYGNCYEKYNSNLRYNLMHFERNSPIKFLFNQINKINFY